jgi:hypothetical protein
LNSPGQSFFNAKVHILVLLFFFGTTDEVPDAKSCEENGEKSRIKHRSVMVTGASVGIGVLLDVALGLGDFVGAFVSVGQLVEVV